jgi:ABC-type Fe3+-hydroxamate transport system substrate-binding protein
MTTFDRVVPEPARDADIDEIQADIERTREHLGETVEALTAKLDVKSRAKDKAQDVKQAMVDRARLVRARGADVAAKAKVAATDDDGIVKPAVPGAAVVIGAVVALGVVLIWRRRR